MNEGTITLKLEGITFEETERIREMIHILISQGVFHVKNGTATLSFDRDALLQDIEIRYKRWKRDKPSDFANPYKNVKIELTK